MPLSYLVLKELVEATMREISGGTGTLVAKAKTEFVFFCLIFFL
jgi:hypothetical protein